MSKQEKKQDTKVEGEGKVKKERVPGMFVPYFLAQNAARDRGMTVARLLVYCWLYAHNEMTGKGQSVPFGKPNIKILARQIGDELGLGSVERHLRNLEKAGWIKRAAAQPLNGVRMTGYLCLMSRDGRAAAKVGEQTELKPMEEVVITMESVVTGKERPEGWPGVGVKQMAANRYYYFNHWGETVYLPVDMPVRPSEGYEWWEPTGEWLPREEWQQRYKDSLK